MKDLHTAVGLTPKGSLEPCVVQYNDFRGRASPLLASYVLRFEQDLAFDDHLIYVIRKDP